MNFLIYKDYQFIPNKILNNNNFGRLSVSMLETGIIKSKINNFSKLKTIDTTYLESEESCIIREINWKIKYRIEKQKDQDSESFSFYVTPMCEDKIIAQNVIKSKISFRIIKNEARFSENEAESNSIEHTFEDSTSAGKDNFILKKD